MTPNAAVDAAMTEARERWDGHRQTILAVANLYGMSRKALAEEMGLSQMTISNRLNGVKPIEPWELAGFAVVLDVPVDVLDMDPYEAVKWVIDNRRGNLRNRCYALTAQLAA